MAHRMFQQSYYFDGTLAANKILNFKAPTDLQIIHVSLNATTAAVGTLKIGKSGSDACYMANTTFGASSVPVEVSRAGFVGTEYPRISKGENVVYTLTHNSMINPNFVITFTEG